MAGCSPAEPAAPVYTTNDHLGSPRINTDATVQAIYRRHHHSFVEEILFHFVDDRDRMQR